MSTELDVLKDIRRTLRKILKALVFPMKGNFVDVPEVEQE